MNNQNSISLQDWSALYEAASEFKQRKCWEWMCDSDLFGVQNPETGEVGYCCVMGQLGQVLALNVYPGPEGLAGYWHLHKQARVAKPGVPPSSQSLLSTQKCIMASFENRAALHEKDLSIIQGLGLKFRGKKEWPMFQSYRPGFLPWFLTLPEVHFLTIALQQAKEVATKIRDNPDLLVSPDPDQEQYLVRILEEGIWKDRWQPPAEYETPQFVPSINEVQLAQLQRADFPRKGTWVTDCILLPVAIQEGDRPYYPYGFPVLSNEGTALGLELLKPGEIERELPNTFMNLLQKVKCLPQSLLVGSEQTFALLEPIARKLGFPIKRAEQLPALEIFLKSMESFLGSSEERH